MNVEIMSDEVRGVRAAAERSPVTPHASHLSRYALAVAALPLLFGACSWFTDFKRQPKIDPWESEADTVATRGNPQMSVPVTGTAVAGFQVSRQALPATIDSMSAIPNPTPVSDVSLANGRKYYQINCAVCHGDQGLGNGPATRYGMPGIGIGAGSNAATRYSDGYIYGMIRNGRGLMPTYDRIEEGDRWDVVNYLRALQGRVPNTAGVGPVGYPGQTGAALPGYTQMGPTRPAPYLKPTRLTSAEAAAGGGTSSGVMETSRGTSTAPGGAPDSAAAARQPQPAQSAPGAARLPAAPGAGTRSGATTTDSAARRPGGAQ